MKSFSSLSLQHPKSDAQHRRVVLRNVFHNLSSIQRVKGGIPIPIAIAT